jgi:hypothetical protein
MRTPTSMPENEDGYFLQRIWSEAFSCLDDEILSMSRQSGQVSWRGRRGREGRGGRGEGERRERKEAVDLKGPFASPLPRTTAGRRQHCALRAACGAIPLGGQRG